MTMTSRERVLAAIAHKEPDRVPIDFGGMPSTGIMAVAYHHLKKYLGTPDSKVRVYDVGQQLAEPEEPILERFHVDVLDARRSLPPSRPGGEAWRPYELLDLTVTPTQVISAETPPDMRLETDDEGGLLMLDKQGRAVARKAKTSLYFNGWAPPILGEAETVGDLEKMWPYEPPSKETLDDLRARCRYMHENTDRAIMLGFGGNILESGQGLRGWEQFMIDLALGERFVDVLLDTMEERWIANLQLVLDACGEYIDLIQMGDDLGTQEACQVSPATYHRMIYPHHKKIYQTIHDHPAAVRVFLHSCGSIEPLIADLIDAGVEALNPVQTSAAGMDPQHLKRTYGKDLTFWGGGCETQSTLPNGTPDQVREEVKQRLGIFAPGGGYVFNMVHNIQANIPPENVEAMFDAAIEFGVY